MVCWVSKRTSAYAIEKSFELLKIIYVHESLSIMDLMNISKLTFVPLRKYLRTLEEMGFVEVIPDERKNVVRLTDRGRCVARCLLTGE